MCSSTGTTLDVTVYGAVAMVVIVPETKWKYLAAHPENGVKGMKMLKVAL